MKRVDTLLTFDELTASGMPIAEARAIIKTLVQSQDIDLNILKTEFRFMNLKLYYIMAIGTVMATVSFIPTLNRMIGN